MMRSMIEGINDASINGYWSGVYEAYGRVSKVIVEKKDEDAAVVLNAIMDMIVKEYNQREERQRTRFST